MHDAATMSLVQCVGDLHSVLEDLLQRKRALFQAFRQRLAFHALHNEVVDSVLMADIIERANVRMIKAGDGFGFSLKALLANGITRKLFGKNFNRNGAI